MIPTIRRRDYGTMSRPWGHCPQATACLSYDDEGRRVVWYDETNSNPNTPHETPAIRWVKDTR